MIKNHPEILSIENETIDQCYIRLAKKKESAPKKTQGTIKRWLGNYGFIENSEGNWHFYVGNIDESQREVKIKPGALVEFVSAKLPNPAATETAERNGKATGIVFL